MNDLADQLIEAQTKAIPKDQYGLIIPPTKTQEFYDYLVQRALVATPALYTYLGRLYNGPAVVLQEDRANLASLIKYYDYIPSQWQVYIYEQLHLKAPHLDRTKIRITPHLLWNYETQKLERI